MENNKAKLLQIREEAEKDYRKYWQRCSETLYKTRKEKTVDRNILGEEIPHWTENCLFYLQAFCFIFGVLLVLSFGFSLLMK